jgi:hypothetical protein
MYALYRKGRGARHRRAWDVVYIGLAAAGGVRARLTHHRRSKAEEWTHFSVFAVWPNIRDDEIRELEGLFRHIYRFDTHANRLNIARAYKALNMVRRESKRDGWMEGARSELSNRALRSPTQ